MGMEREYGELFTIKLVREGMGLCAECICDMLAEEEWEIG